MDLVRWRLGPGLIMRRERIAANQRFHGIFTAFRRLA